MGQSTGQKKEEGTKVLEKTQIKSVAIDPGLRLSAREAKFHRIP